MSGPREIAWLNGALLPLAEARISPLDRGFLYADAVYEVVPVYAGRPFLLGQHCARLERSLAAIAMPMPYTAAQWAHVLGELTRANGGGDQYVYLQVSRGAEWGRNHAIPAAITPTVFAFCADLPTQPAPEQTEGVAAITCAESRWTRCDIKSTNLLANVLAKSRAGEAGATEAIFVEAGLVHEGSSSAVLIVRGGRVHAPAETPRLLPSTTRALVLALCADVGLGVVVGDTPAAWLAGADEVWMCNATRGVLPIVRLDGAAVGNGLPGPCWLSVRRRFDRFRAACAGLDPLASPPPL